MLELRTASPAKAMMKRPPFVRLSSVDSQLRHPPPIRHRHRYQFHRPNCDAAPYYHRFDSLHLHFHGHSNDVMPTYDPLAIYPAGRFADDHDAHRFGSIWKWTRFGF